MAKQKQGITWTNERRKLSDLIPWERNPRTINSAQAERLVDSVETFGQVETLAIDCRNNILNGHQRASVLAGQHGMDYEVDVRVANRVLTERERQQLTVYLHKGTTGHFDFEELANSFEFGDLVAWGFSEEELLGLDFGEEPTSAGADTEPQIDKAEELRVKWGVETGMMFALGDHRLICGDCTDPATVGRVMGGEKAVFTFADPPYGKNYQSNMRQKSAKFEVLQNDDTIDASFVDNVLAFSDGWVIVCTSWDLCFDWRPLLSPLGEMQNMIIWDKGGGYLGDLRHSLGTDYEILFAFNREAEIKGKRIGSVWSLGKDSPEDYVHATQKPTALLHTALECFTIGNSIVYEPFSGSGTTIIACQNLGRRCRAVEISEGYTAVALERFFQHTSIEPVLVS